METKGWLQSSQKHATCPYPNLEKSSPCPAIPLLQETILILYSHQWLGFWSVVSFFQVPHE